MRLWYRGAMTPTATPTYSAKRRFSIWDTALLAVAGFMLLQGIFIGGDVFRMVAGLGVGIFMVFTSHSRYDLYPDALVIRYKAPRKIVVPLSEVQDVRSAKLPFGGPALLIHRKGGRVLAIMPTDPEGFLSQINAGLSAKKEPPKSNGDAQDEPGKPTPRRRRPRRLKS